VLFLCHQIYKAPCLKTVTCQPAGARRRTTKAVNYAKEQDFSGDEDVFEDEAEEEEKAPIAKRRGRPRKSTSAATGDVRMEQADDDDRGFIDKPIYTEKGYDPSLPPLRDRFPFLPEYEADGSPRIELIIGRRPVVDHHKKDLDDLLDDEHPDEAGGAGKRAAARHRNQQEVASSPVVSTRKKKGVKDDVPSGSEDVEYEYSSEIQREVLLCTWHGKLVMTWSP
jgi:hypothetical protein